MRTAWAGIIALAACVPGQGPLMAAGQDCLHCHDGSSAKLWTAAGTWGGPNSQVTISDASGKTITLRTNQAGNFYTAESLSFPLKVSVDGRAMPAAVAYGGCNKCHAGGGLMEMGPNMMPGSDCLTCHDGTGGVKRFTAAGTWSGAGLTVTLSGATTVTLTTNQVGNFYTDAALGPSFAARVNGWTMPGRVTYGGCNKCHGGGGKFKETGPNMMPGSDCLICHDGTSGVRRFTAAGTWSGPGATVTLSGATTVTLTTNQVGNFYTDAPLGPSFAARVNGTKMPALVTYGGCNSCHAGGATDAR